VYAAIGDFNGDGIPDLATTNYDDNTVSVLLGDGTGKFNAVAQTAIPPMGVNPISVGVGDFNGDGLPDLGVVNFNSTNMNVLLTENTETAVTTVSGVAPVGRRLLLQRWP
jgi:hypothetical protein